ncbi:hypothetical protein ACQQ7A_11680, partial [Corynebacterium diphtheriae]
LSCACWATFAFSALSSFRMLQALGALVRHSEDCSHISHGHSSVSHCNSEVTSSRSFFGASFHFHKAWWENNINNNVEFVWV